MAVVKVKYTKSRGKIKAHLRYITHRPTRDGERQARPLFDNDGKKDKPDAYRFIDEAPKGSRFYKLILSPDPKTEDPEGTLDLWQVAKQTIGTLSERLGTPITFIGVEHNDHSANRHVHLVFAHQGRLTRKDIRALKEAVTLASGATLRQRQRFQEQVASRQFQIRILPPQPKRQVRLALRRFFKAVLFCPVCDTYTTQVPLRENKYFCQTCHRVTNQEVSLGFSQEAGRER
jgi:hypothetical protein